MKKLLLLLIVGFISLNAFGQDPDPDLFQTWYLHQIEFDLGDTMFVSDITPGISPTLTVSETLEFNGFGACNDFSGNFSYEIVDGEEMITPSNYNDTGLTCAFQSHNDFENQYFGYFDSGLGIPLRLYVDPTTLHLEIAPGFILKFKDTPVVLAIADNQNPEFKIFPNPTSGVLFIASERGVIQSISVYNTIGQLVLKQSENLGEADVSELNQGIYFLEIISGERKTIQKFIKI